MEGWVSFSLQKTLNNLDNYDADFRVDIAALHLVLEGMLLLPFGSINSKLVTHDACLQSLKLNLKPNF